MPESTRKFCNKRGLSGRLFTFSIRRLEYLLVTAVRRQRLQTTSSNIIMPRNKQVHLKRTDKADLEVLYQFQLDKEAMYLAAFTPTDQTDLGAYVEKFTRFLQDPSIHMRTILVEDTVVGSIAKFEIEGEAEITYWLDRSFWGNSIATTALEKFLRLENARPIIGRVAFDNIGSQRVLEKCGFVKIGTDQGFANARQMEIEEFIYKLT